MTSANRNIMANSSSYGRREGKTLQLGDGQSLADATWSSLCLMNSGLKMSPVRAGRARPLSAAIYHKALVAQAGLRRITASPQLGGRG